MRRASAGDGGWNNVFGGSSILEESAVAVEREMVGKERDAVLICDGDELRKTCWLFAAASRAA
jgi:hypothetical protein